MKNLEFPSKIRI